MRINFGGDKALRKEIERVRNQIQAFQTRMKNRLKEEKLRGFINEVAAQLGFTNQADEDELFYLFN